MDDRGIVVRFSTQARSFFFSRSFQSDSGANEVSYSIVTAGTMPGQKRPGRRDHHSPPSNSDFKNE